MALLFWDCTSVLFASVSKASNTIPVREVNVLNCLGFIGVIPFTCNELPNDVAHVVLVLARGQILNTTLDRIVEQATALCWRYGLRAYDAIHLASALTRKNVAGDEVIFACFDHAPKKKESCLQRGLPRLARMS